MVQLMLTESQQRLIDESNGPVSIVDRAGRVLTTVMRGFTEADLQLVAEDARDFRPTGTLRELLDRLDSQLVVSQ